VRTRLLSEARPVRRTAWGPIHGLRRALSLALLALALLAGAVLALSPGTRTAMAQWLRLHGIVLFYVPAERAPAPVEAAAYFLVAHLARTARGPLTVTGALAGGRLVVELAATGPLDGDLVGVEDRIGALDGRLTVERGTDARVAVRAEVPCAS
jgi:hypothetical protein